MDYWESYLLLAFSILLWRAEKQDHGCMAQVCQWSRDLFSCEITYENGQAMDFKTFSLRPLGWLRSFIADYGVPLMVLVWTALSFSVPSKVPSGVPRRFHSPLAWQSTSLHHWTVVKVNPLPLSIRVRALVVRFIFKVSHKRYFYLNSSRFLSES